MRSALLLLLVLACFGALFLWFFAPVLFQDRQFGFRDAGHYYYPLHARVQKEWEARRWPLWEPEENGGMPLLGNPTAAVLYPGKVVFAVLPYKWAARVYIVAHSALAFAAMLCLMRSWGAGWTGSGVSALGYTFGAPILFQSHNIIYLVGAAWLPLGVHAVDQWVRLGRRWAVLELAAVLALQVLGGDPESAFLLGVAGAGYALAFSRTGWQGDGGWNEDGGNGSNRRAGGKKRAVTAFAVVAAWFAMTLVVGIAAPLLRPAEAGLATRPLPWLSVMNVVAVAAWVGVAGFYLWRCRGRPWRSPTGAGVLGLVVAACLAAAVTAAQLFPVIEFTQQTTRAWELGTREAYDFSIEPHRLVELIWPGISGAQFGGNTQWAELIRLPGVAPRVWAPSLYFGVLTFVLALSALRLRQGPPWLVWISWIAIFSLLGGLGTYTSPIWATRAGAAAAHRGPVAIGRAELGSLDERGPNPNAEDRFLRDGDGSIYWLLTAILPGFRQFRYPAKLFTFTTLALSALAGIGCERMRNRRNRRASMIAAVLLAVSVCILAAVLIERVTLRNTFQRLESFTIFGPFDADGAVRAIFRSLVHTSVVLVVGLLSFKLIVSRPRYLNALLVIVSLDLAVAGEEFIPTVPQSTFETMPEARRIIERDERARREPGPFRVHRVASWNPPSWRASPSPERVNDVVAWERGTLQAKYGINLGVEYTHTLGAAELHEYEWIFAYRRGFDMWNTRYFILPYVRTGSNDEMRETPDFLSKSRQVFPDENEFSGADGKGRRDGWMLIKDYRIQRNEQALPRAWVVHRVWAAGGGGGRSGQDRSGTIAEMLDAGDGNRTGAAGGSFDPREGAWVAGDDVREMRPRLSGRAASTTESVTVRYPSPQEAVLEVEMESPGLVVLADVDYPGWELTIDGEAARIYRVNRRMRGALVGEKKHRLVFGFAPRSFRIGLVVSCMGLAGLLLLGVYCAFRPVEPMLAGVSGPGGRVGRGAERACDRVARTGDGVWRPSPPCKGEKLCGSLRVAGGAWWVMGGGSSEGCRWLGGSGVANEAAGVFDEEHVDFQ